MKNAASIKIAAITDDGKTISQHFGRARLLSGCHGRKWADCET